MTEKQTWESLDIIKVLKEGKGFLLLANLVLSSFQRRLGTSLATAPGRRDAGGDSGRPRPGHALLLRRPRSPGDAAPGLVASSSLWNRTKLLASLLASSMSKEEISKPEQLEELKDKSVLDNMMGELAERAALCQGSLDRRARPLPRLQDIPGGRLEHRRGRRGRPHATASRAGSCRSTRGEAGSTSPDIEKVRASRGSPAPRGLHRDPGAPRRPDRDRLPEIRRDRWASASSRNGSSSTG